MAKRYQFSTLLYAKDEVDLTPRWVHAADRARRGYVQLTADRRADRGHLGGREPAIPENAAKPKTDAHEA